jgi:hypothetical protein
VNLARELMGHTAVPMAALPEEKLSRPAELVQRAKQLAQLANVQFGRPTTPAPVAEAKPAAAEPQKPPFVLEPEPTPMDIVPPLLTATSFTQQFPLRLTTSEWPPATELLLPSRPLSSILVAGETSGFEPLQPAPEMKTTNQKIEEFYGVKQIGAEVLFAVHFDHAKSVQLAGDFNNWTPQSTPMTNGSKPGHWRKVLPLKPGRYKYRLVVDGKWVTDPNNRYVEANQFGELDNVIEVGKPSAGAYAAAA